MTPFADLLICVRFFSRLPVPLGRYDEALGSGGLARAAAMAPLAGTLIAAVPAAIIVAAWMIGLPSSVAGLLAIGGLVIVTGALHEDGLADCADGFGGGRSIARKLEIMRDSRIGAFGAAAIALVLYLRSVALSAALARGVGEGVGALVLGAVLSRTACLAPLFLLPAARSEGLGAANARPTAASIVAASALAASLAALTAIILVEPARVAAAVVVAGFASLLVCAVARRQIGGQTGDVAGAAQQVAEAGVLVVFAAVS